MSPSTPRTLRTVRCTRYVVPLREGGSLPAVIEADDDGLHVLKFRGAGQGPKALVAELLCGMLARALDLPMPDLVLVELDAALARIEADPEIQQLLRRSTGLNLASDYLPGAITYDPVVGPPLDPALAARVVWFDALVANVDRSPRNANLLWWHHALWLIDHGAALYFQHAWDQGIPTSLGAVKNHVLLPRVDDASLADAHAALSPRVTEELLVELVSLVPTAWLEGEGAFPGVEQHRRAYVDALLTRLRAAPQWMQEARDARAARL